MGDYSWAQLTVISATDEELVKIARILDGEGMGTDDVTLWDSMTVDEMRLGHMAEIAQEIIKQCPNATIYADQAAYYDSPGDVVIHTPTLGTYQHDVDQNGNPVIYPQQIAEIVEQAKMATADQVLRVMWEQYGRPWFQEVERLRALMEEAKQMPKFSTQEEADAWLDAHA